VPVVVAVMLGVISFWHTVPYRSPLSGVLLMPLASGAAQIPQPTSVVAGCWWSLSRQATVLLLSAAF
jgi:hypothetical protein